jgi:hypothetical protein
MTSVWTRSQQFSNGFADLSGRTSDGLQRWIRCFQGLAELFYNAIQSGGLAHSMFVQLAQTVILDMAPQQFTQPLQATVLSELEQPPT